MFYSFVWSKGRYIFDQFFLVCALTFHIFPFWLSAHFIEFSNILLSRYRHQLPWVGMKLSISIQSEFKSGWNFEQRKQFLNRDSRNSAHTRRVIVQFPPSQSILRTHIRKPINSDTRSTSKFPFTLSFSLFLSRSPQQEYRKRTCVSKWELKRLLIVILSCVSQIKKLWNI